MSWLRTSAMHPHAAGPTAAIISLFIRSAGWAAEPLSNLALIQGEDPGREITATVFRNHPHEFAALTLRSQTVKATAARADFPFPSQMDGRSEAQLIDVGNPPNRFRGGVAATLPVVMIGTPPALCVQETMAFMNTMELAVEQARTKLSRTRER